MSAENTIRPPSSGASAASSAGVEGVAQELAAAVAALQGRVRALLGGGGAALSAEQRTRVAQVEADLARAQEHLGRLQAPGGGSGGEPLPAPAASGTDRGRFSVLYADDDGASRDLIGELLGRFFDVYLAADGAEAVQLARSLRPDIIVTDLNMPGLDGLSLLSLVRNDEETSHIPLLVVSASTQTEAKVQCFEAGAIDYLTKPVVPNELVARVRNALVRSEDLRRERVLQATDDLTGLPNRRQLRSFLGAALRTAARARSELTLVMVDQDRLKQINDVHGHAAGDLAIRALAQALSTCKRTGDLAARIGGDEFVVSMPETDRAGASRFVVRVQEELLRQVLRVDGRELIVSASFGLASASEHDWEETAEQLLQRADRALYEAKRELRARLTD